MKCDKCGVELHVAPAAWLGEHTREACLEAQLASMTKRVEDAEDKLTTAEEALRKAHNSLGRCEDHTAFQGSCVRCMIEKALGYT